MAATTININPTDTHNTVQVAAGGTPGSRGIQIIIDDTKITNMAQAVLALEKAAEVVAAEWPLPAS